MRVKLAGSAMGAKLEKLITWGFIVLALAIAVAANAISTIWAQSGERFSLWLLALVAISPLVFISFGLVTARTGLLVSAGTIDSLLTLSTILVALIAFQEWQSLTMIKSVGIGCTVLGIILLHWEG
ncbi:MAG: hypothetical protein U5N55_00420 [Cypionkella sp.]|nr:hypothetical protein [Cypionkella sp.]